MNVRRAFVAENPNFQPISIPEVKKSYLEMRPNQLELLQDYGDERFMKVCQPPGSGKSIAAKFSFARFLEDNPHMKVIVAVPQTIIAPNFGSDILRYPDGREVKWQIDPLNDLSGPLSGKLDSIIKFTNTKEFPNGIHERILICTHQGLALSHKKAGKLSFKNTILLIDESHHVMLTQDHEILNRLGAVVGSILKSKDTTSRLWFMTATNDRGDNNQIIPPKYENKFATYFIPLDKHFATLKHIKSYSYDYVPYTCSYSSLIKSMKILLQVKKNHKKTIMYVPGVGRKWAGPCKEKTVAKLKKDIHAVWPEANILDLITESGRDDRKKHLMDKSRNQDIDIVLAVSMLNEGVDWPEASQILDLAPSNSMTVAKQRFGRLIRDELGKKHLSYYIFFSFGISFSNKEKCRRKLSENFAALSASFVIEESIIPAKIPSKKGKSYSDVSANDRSYIWAMVSEEILRLKFQDKLSLEDIKNSIRIILERHGIEDENVVKSFVARLVRRAIPKFKDADVSYIIEAGFDKIEWEEVSNYIASFASGKCDKKTLGDLKQLIIGRELKSNEMTRQVGDFRNEHGRYPNHGSKDKEERKMGYWLASRREAQRGFGLSLFYESDLQIAIEIGCPDMFEPQNLELNSNKMTRKVGAFIKKHGRPPSASSKDTEEAQMGIWLTGKRRAKRGVGPNWFYESDSRIAIEIGCPDMFETRNLELESNEMTRQVGVFIKEHGRRPRRQSKDEKERKMAKWLSSKKEAKKGLGAGLFYESDLQIAIEIGCPDMFESRNLELESNEMTRQVGDFRNKHGRYPNRGSKDKEERKMAKWLSRRRGARRGLYGCLFYESDLQIAIDIGCPDMFELQNREIESNEMTRKVGAFRNKHGRYPNSDSKDKEEAKLGRWLVAKKRANRGLGKHSLYESDSQIAIEIGCPDMFESRNLELESNEMTRQVGVFRNKHGRYPNSHSKDKEEAKMANWLIGKRGSKKGVGQGLFYESDLVIAIDIGCPDMFEPQR